MGRSSPESSLAHMRLALGIASWDNTAPGPVDLFGLWRLARFTVKQEMGIWVDLGPSNDVQKIGKDETSVCQTRSIGSPHVQKDHTSSGQGLCPRHFRSSQVSLSCSLLRRSLTWTSKASGFDGLSACGCGMHQFFWSPILTHTTSIVSTIRLPQRSLSDYLLDYFQVSPVARLFCTVCVTEATIKLPHLKVRQFWEKVWAHLISEILDAWVLTNGNH